MLPCSRRRCPRPDAIQMPLHKEGVTFSCCFVYHQLVVLNPSNHMCTSRLFEDKEGAGQCDSAGGPVHHWRAWWKNQMLKLVLFFLGDLPGLVKELASVDRTPLVMMIGIMSLSCMWQALGSHRCHEESGDTWWIRRNICRSNKTLVALRFVSQSSEPRPPSWVHANQLSKTSSSQEGWCFFHLQWANNSFKSPSNPKTQANTENHQATQRKK